jgi:hypothetical protein
MGFDNTGRLEGQISDFFENSKSNQLPAGLEVEFERSRGRKVASILYRWICRVKIYLKMCNSSKKFEIFSMR